MRRCKLSSFFHANFISRMSLARFVATDDDGLTRSVFALNFAEREGEGVHRREVPPRDRAEHPSQTQVGRTRRSANWARSVKVSVSPLLTISM